MPTAFICPHSKRGQTASKTDHKLTIDYPYSTVVNFGKNLIRIWIEFDKKMVLFFRLLEKAIFGRFSRFLNYF